MNINELLQYTGKRADEQAIEHVQFAVEEANTGLFSFMHVLLSNVYDLHKYLELWGKYLFPIAFGLKLANWFTEGWAFLNASNKNLAKTNNLLAKTITTVLVGLAIFGATVVGASMVPIIFSITVVMDVFVAIGKSIGYGIMAAGAKGADLKNYYASHAKENAIKAGVGIIVLGGIILGMIVAPYVALAIVAVASFVTAATLIAVGVLGFVKKVQAYRQQKALKQSAADPDNQVAPQPQISRQVKNDLVVSEVPSVQPLVPAEQIDVALNQANNISHYKISSRKTFGFFDNMAQVLSPVTMLNSVELMNAIIRYETKINDEINHDKDNFMENYLWNEGAKRHNKLAALQFLKAFINKFDSILAVENSQTVQIDGQRFNYKNINDLILQIDSYITHHFPKAYQSFLKEIGGVETFAKESYKLLIAKANVKNDVVFPAEQNVKANVM